ncbi:MAG: hypothetical protein Q4C53_04960 [Clostridia bacterium]|nr:hypothetical protein [Clostridia bacterium]
MKRTTITTLGTMMLAATFLMSGFAFAEDAASDAVAPVAEQTTTVDAASSDAALTDALNAYRTARRNNRQKERLEAFETELNAMVEAGTLTREQADLLLKDRTDRMNAANTVCSACGQQIGNSACTCSGNRQARKANRGNRANSGCAMQNGSCPMTGSMQNGMNGMNGRGARNGRMR